MLEKKNALTIAVSAALIAMFAGCGGGGGSDSPEEPPAPTLVTLSGTVAVNQAVKNAVVCLDLNANNACDANEPVSAKTGADGNYSLSYKSSEVTPAQASTSSLVALIQSGSISDGATSIDAADTTTALTTKSYALKQVPGKSGQINPLTTLVAAGVAQGMTEATSRANVAVQLSIAEAKIDNYRDDPVSDPSQVQDNARTMAGVTAAALELGATLRVGDQAQTSTAAPGSLATLRYADAGNYFVRTLDVEAKAAGAGPQLVKDARNGMTQGATTAETSLYTQAYPSNGTWTFCNASVPISTTVGNPNRSTFCNAQKSVGFGIEDAIAGQAMSAVISDMQTDSSTNTINAGQTTIGLLTKLGTSTFPADARLQRRVTLNLTQPLFINNVVSDVWPSTVTTLEQVIAGSPSSSVVLATGRGTLGLGLGSAEDKVLRVAFAATTSPTSGTVQFYECDFNAAQNTIANCIATQAGNYTITTLDGVRVLRYAGNPETVMNHHRLHAEVASVTGLPTSGPRVFVVRENKPAVPNPTQTKRLNAAAWAAMRAVLGI